MGIWDSLRRFSTRGTSGKDITTKRRLGAGKNRLKERSLQLEKFEERMLLSITTPNLDEASVNAEALFGEATITPPAAGAMSLVVRADSPDDYRPTVTFNVNAADTTNVEHVTSGGSLNLDLTGAGYTVGVWDGGSVLSTHQEFGSRVTVIDGAASHPHATHVGGTIGASGVDPAAKGMATEVEIRSYDWDLDYAEMAADGSLIDVSNHSYGAGMGWTYTFDPASPTLYYDVWLGDMSVNAVEDATFGKYTSGAAQLDQVLYSNSELLSVWSAGNDRNDAYMDLSGDGNYIAFFSIDPGLTGWSGAGYYVIDAATYPPPGGDGNGGTGYDSVAPDQTAKNALMVGAVNDVTADPYVSSQIQMSDFSGWGPTDDGRIKPDVVGNGVQLYSSVDDSDSSYDTYDGTSMASPNVAGTAVLLKEHFENTIGYSPLSSTLKGLIIHTASDAGNIGPDYSYGWGLVNAEAAAEMISAAAIGEEATIMEGIYTGSEITIDVVSAGLNPLTATIAWTDLPSSPHSGAVDDTSPNLVNDLDLWITDAAGNVYYPWTLNPANPSLPAVQTRLNHIDNVEQVNIAIPNPGEYTIHIDATSTISSQQFSLFLNNEGRVVAPELVLVIPQEGGFVDRGDTLNIAPRELVLRFNEGQTFIDESVNPARDPNGWLSGGRSGIQVTRSVNGVWGDGDDEIVEIGWIGIGDRSNDVVLRFAESLPDDNYRISIIGSEGYVGPDGQLVEPLRNTQFVTFRSGEDIVDEHFEFELDLGAQVTAVVQQPVVVTSATIVATSAANIQDGTTFTVGDGKDRVTFEINNPGASNYVPGLSSSSSVRIDVTATDDADDVALAVAAAIRNQTVAQGGVLDIDIEYFFNTADLTLNGQRVVFYGRDLPFTVTEQREQLEDTIEVYFNDDDLAFYNDPVADPGNDFDLRPEFFQLIVTNDTATLDDDLLYDPADGATPVRKLQPVEIRYDADLDRAILRFDKPLSDYGTGAFRLRIGNEYKKIETSSLVPSVEVVNGSLAQGGENWLGVAPGSEIEDGTTFRISDGQFDASVEMDLQAVVLEVVPGNVPANGELLTIDGGSGEIDISLAVSSSDAATAAGQIASQLSALGYNAWLDPVAPFTRILVINALSAQSAKMTVSDASFSVLEPTDLTTLVDGEWLDVDGVRYELELPGGDGLSNDPATLPANLVTVTGTGSLGALARGDVVRDLAGVLAGDGISAIAYDTRLFLLDATTVSGAVPAVSVEDAVYSIQQPGVASDVQDGEWIEVNTGTSVLRFEFDRDGSVSGSIAVPISGTDILTPLRAAMASNGLNTLLYNPGTATARLVVVDAVNVVGGGVDPDMVVTHGFAVDVPNGLTANNDGEYVELYDEQTQGWIRFEIDTDGIVGSSSVRVDVNDATQLSTSDADALENEINTRGFGTILDGDRVYLFSSSTRTLTDVAVGDVGALHLAVETPAAVSGQTDGVIEYHAGMSATQMTQLIAAEMEAQIADKGLYLQVISSSPYVGLVSPDDAGDSYHTANELRNFGNQGGAQSIIVSAAIDAQELLLEWPGAVDEPGHRDLPWHSGTLIEDHYVTGDSYPDSTDGITTYYYNFQDVYGYDPASSQPLLNQITEAQKELARQVFDLYAEYLGVSFVESTGQGFLIATGDLKATGTLFSEPGGVAGVAFGNIALMDQAESWGANVFGGSWFEVAMHEIGHLLGYGHAYDLIAGSIMGTAEESSSSTTSDTLYPGEHDIVHGQHMYRPDSIDVDLYRFELQQRGTLNAELFAERMNDSSLLDGVITIYQEVTVEDEDGNPKITYELVARNDDYYSKDSFLELYLQPGVYYAGVSASGNTDYDANIDNTGVGGVSQGEYQLRLTFTPGGVDPDDPASFRGDETDHLVDSDGTATKFDGDADGVPGGTYDFWFNVQEETVFVDKTSTSTTEDGSLANPYKTIQKAFLKSGDPGVIVRVLGNNFYDDDPNDLSTYDDNVPYQIGENPDTYRALADGRRMEVPQGVTVVIDAGALFKLSEANVDVGSAAESIDRSGGSLQVLGTPLNSVIFTSFRDAEIGIDIDPSNNLPDKGDWGGLVFRNELDYDFINDYDPASGLSPREVLETQGIFLNYVNHADIRYGGGAVEVDGLTSVYAPIHMIEARPTITYNRITQSADAALAADPNSFADTRFQSWDAYAPYTTSYNRVGPEIRGNYIVENSTNGIFVRISTAAGSAIKELEVAGRFDDWDIVHVIPENLFVNGTSGGPLLTEETNPLILADANHIVAVAGASIPDQDTFSIFDGRTRVVFEFDLGANVAPGHIAIPYTLADSAADVAASIRAAIDQARQQYGLDITVDLTESGAVVSLTNVGRASQHRRFRNLRGTSRCSPANRSRHDRQAGRNPNRDGDGIPVDCRRAHRFR